MSGPPVYSHDVTFAAMCIMEEMISSVIPDAPQPWRTYWDQVGVNEMREVAIELAPHADAAWERARDRAEAAYADPNATEIGDPGSFDYDFIPVWLRHCVTWPQEAPWDRPSAKIQPEPAPLPEPEPEPVRLSDNVSVDGALACPGCGDQHHLYDRADVRYAPATGAWEVGDREGSIDCTSCDWTGTEADLKPKENNHG
jgi:hypothetical protein